MYIRAKYPKIGNEFGGANAKPQRFGSLYNIRTISDITRIDRSETLITINDSQFNK
tara:strand:- start:22297 stop:22464 length:168 start_codon:yes stop_codon:yes gene_type:complete